MGGVTLDLHNVQGDLFNRGFPKFNEVYYFFTIAQDMEKDFSKALKALVSEKDKHIFSLTKVLANWVEVDRAASYNWTSEGMINKRIISTANTLIAFSKSGLDRVNTQLEWPTQILMQANTNWVDWSELRPKLPEIVGSRF